MTSLLPSGTRTVVMPFSPRSMAVRAEGKPAVTHYTVRETTFSPPPVQSPRIPVWIAGMWPSHRPFRRAAKWDGVVPIHADITPLSVDELREIVAYVQSTRPTADPFDVVIGGESSGSGPYVWKTPIAEQGSSTSPLR